MEKEFFPNRRTGLGVLTLLLLGVAALIYWLVYTASGVLGQPSFTLMTSLAIALLAIWLWLAMRLHTLLTTRYALARGGLELRWGLRKEVIPLPDLQWIHPVSDFKAWLPLPLLSLPGIVYGKRQVAGLGKVEFAATQRRDFLLVASRGRYFVISPQEKEDFLALFERLTEMGSLENFTPLSEGFATLWGRMWSDRTARRLILVGLLASIALTLEVLLLSSRQPAIVWMTLETVSSQRLWQLAFLAWLAWIGDVCVGFVFFLHGSMEKTFIYLFLSMPILLCLILGIAMLIMAL